VRKGGVKGRKILFEGVKEKLPTILGKTPKIREKKAKTGNRPTTFFLKKRRIGKINEHARGFF